MYIFFWMASIIQIFSKHFTNWRDIDVCAEKYVCVYIGLRICMHIYEKGRQRKACDRMLLSFMSIHERVPH